MLLIVALLLTGFPQSPSTPAKPTDPALAAKIDEWFRAAFAADDETKEVAEAQMLYQDHGLPTPSQVGDLPSYEFVVLLSSDKLPLDFRNQVLLKVKESARQREIPSDAATFLEAKLRIEKAKTAAEAHSPTNHGLRDEIERMFKADQQVRQHLDTDLTQMQKADRQHASPLQRILDRYGIPTYSMVGPEAAGHFVVMIQHQPAQFRRQVLPKLEALVEAGQADPESYALVYDRSQGDVGKKQRYGENFVCNPGEKLHMAPVEDEPHLNQRRAELGLVRIEVYERILAETMPQFCPPTTAKK